MFLALCPRDYFNISGGPGQTKYVIMGPYADPELCPKLREGSH